MYFCVKISLIFSDDLKDYFRTFGNVISCEIEYIENSDNFLKKANIIMENKSKIHYLKKVSK